MKYIGFQNSSLLLSEYGRFWFKIFFFLGLARLSSVVLVGAFSIFMSRPVTSMFRYVNVFNVDYFVSFTVSVWLRLFASKYGSVEMFTFSCPRGSTLVFPYILIDEVFVIPFMLKFLEEIYVL